MKKYSLFSLLVSCIVGLSSCTDLSETLYSSIPQDEYGKTPEEMNSLIGPAYGSLVRYVNNEFWMVQISTDEYMIPARGFDWYSGGIHLRYHTHEWSAQETPDCWRFTEVTTINKIIDMIDNTTVEIENVDRVYAELRGLRAFWYFYMLDHIGNVPIVTSFSETELPKNNTRKEVYDFVEKELLEIMDDLTEEKSADTYCKFTKWVGYTLLAKLYLNAEVYTGTPQWGKCQEYCQKVIDSGLYTLEPSIFNNFKYEDNSSSENIFSIPYDADYFTDYFIPYQMSWHYQSYLTFNQQYSSWNGPCAVPSFVESFDEYDARLGSFLYGPQFAASGEPLYTRDGDPLDYTIQMKDFSNATEYEGARLFKWEVEPNGRTHMNNDFTLFRYADILLMKAECMLRTGDEPGARTIVNEVRARNFDPEKPYEFLTLDLLLQERGYEFVFEGWRRNDQIRFDQFRKTWSFKPNEDDPDRHTYLFPIPLTVMDKNPNLIQNPGY